jgi:quercetin dioxygenase-like cupin family protein
MPIAFPALFTTCDWQDVPETEHRGETGSAFWKTQEYCDIRVRMVRYTPGYLADHWCKRGHILLVLSGTLVTEVEGGAPVTLHAGMSYAVADGASSHRSHTQSGATLFIVD